MTRREFLQRHRLRGANNVLIDAGNVNANTVLGQFFVVFADGLHSRVNNEISGGSLNSRGLKVKEVQAGYAFCAVVKGSARSCSGAPMWRSSTSTGERAISSR
jgi:hypothetical protein